MPLALARGHLRTLVAVAEVFSRYVYLERPPDNLAKAIAAGRKALGADPVRTDQPAS